MGAGAIAGIIGGVASVASAGVQAYGASQAGKGGGSSLGFNPPKWMNAFAWPGWLAEMGRLYPGYKVIKNPKGEIIGFDYGKPAPYAGTPHSIAPVDDWQKQGWQGIADLAGQGDPNLGYATDYIGDSLRGDYVAGSGSVMNPQNIPMLNPELNPTMQRAAPTPGSPTQAGNPNSGAWWLQPDAPTAGSLYDNLYAKNDFGIERLGPARSFGQIEGAAGLGRGGYPQVSAGGSSAPAEKLNLEDPTKVLNPYRERLMEDTLSRISDNYRDAIAPATAGKFARAGIFGSSAYGDTEAQNRYSLGRSLEEAGTNLADKFYSEDLNARLAHARNLIAERDPRLSYAANTHATDVGASIQAQTANQRAALEDITNRRNLAVGYEQSLNSRDLADVQNKRQLRYSYNNLWQDYVNAQEGRDLQSRMQTKNLAETNLDNWINYVNAQEGRSLQDAISLRDTTRGYMADYLGLYGAERNRQQAALSALPMLRGERYAPSSALIGIGGQRRGTMQEVLDSLWEYSQTKNVEWPFRRDEWLADQMTKYAGGTGIGTRTYNDPGVSSTQRAGAATLAGIQGLQGLQGLWSGLSSYDTGLQPNQAGPSANYLGGAFADRQ